MKRNLLVLPLLLGLLSSCNQNEEIKTFSIKYSVVDGITFRGENSVKQNQTYEFSLSLQEGYKTGLDFKVICNEEVLNGDNFSYKVENVNSDLNVSVSGIEKISYNVNFISSDGISFEGESSVIYGNSYTFKVSSSEKYTFDSIKVLENDKEKEFQSLDSSTYIVSNVKGDLSIGVNNKKVRTFLVEKDFDSSHYIFKGANEVEYGSSYSFEFELAPGFYKGDDYIFLVNDMELEKNDEGLYVIENVTSGVRIESFGELEVKINVDFECNIENALNNQSEEIKYSLDVYSFTLDFASNYSQSKDRVKVYSSIDGVETLLQKDENGTYSLPNPKKDFKIVVKDASINTYDVDFYYNDEVIYAVNVEAGAKISNDDLELAEAKFNEKASASGYRFEYWNEEIGPINEDTSIHGFASFGISSLDELTSSGSFYLKNDIEITSIKNMPSFNGYLNGDGHLIHSKITTLLTSGTSNCGVLFSSFGGTIKNLKLDFTIGFASINTSGIAHNMEGGCIENIDAKITYSGIMYDTCGSLVGVMNGGVIKNCNVDFFCYDFASTENENFPVGAILGNLVSGKVNGINVDLPGGIDANKVKLIAKGDASKLSLCSISSSQVKIKDSSVGGSLEKETYEGLPVYSKNIENGMGGAIFDSFDITKYSKLSFYIKADNYNKGLDTFGINGSNSLRLITSTSSREVWHYIEITNLLNGSFMTRAYPIGTDSNCNLYPIYEPSYSEMEATSLFELGRFYSWLDDCSATVHATSLYGTLLGK